MQKAAPARYLKVCSQRRARGWSVCSAEPGAVKKPLAGGTGCQRTWSLPCLHDATCTAASGTPPWGIFQQVCGSRTLSCRGRGNNSGAACGVLASGEVSAAYMVLNFVLGNGGSLIALWCVFVSL